MTAATASLTWPCLPNGGGAGHERVFIVVCTRRNGDPWAQRQLTQRERVALRTSDRGLAQGGFQFQAVQRSYRCAVGKGEKQHSPKDRQEEEDSVAFTFTSCTLDGRRCGMNSKLRSKAHAPAQPHSASTGAKGRHVTTSIYIARSRRPSRSHF